MSREHCRDCKEAGKHVQHCVSINTAARGLIHALEHYRDEEASQFCAKSAAIFFWIHHEIYSKF